MKFPNEVDAEFVELAPRKRLPAPPRSAEVQRAPAVVPPSVVQVPPPPQAAAIPAIDLALVTQAVQQFHKNPLAFVLNLAATEVLRRSPVKTVQRKKARSPRKR